MFVGGSPLGVPTAQYVAITSDIITFLHLLKPPVESRDHTRSNGGLECKDITELRNVE